jgi:hypothetical protein
MKNNNISNSEIIDKYKISKASFFRIINKRKSSFNNNLNDIELNDAVISNSNNDISICKNYSNLELFKFLVINNKVDIKN